MKGRREVITFGCLISVILFVVHVCGQSLNNCTAYGPNGASTDLSPLSVSDPNNYYQGGASNGDEFYFNICGTVSTVYCKSTTGSAVCQIIPSTGSQYSAGLYSTQVLTYINSTQSKIVYTGGATCQNQAGTPKRMTTITINYNPSVPGVYVGTVIESTCAYSITMETNLITGSECIAKNETLNESMNLTSLTISSGSSSYYEQSDALGDKYYFNICGTVTDKYCTSKSETSVCQITTNGEQYSAGKITSQSLSLINQTTSVVYYGGGDKCSTGAERNTMIYVTYDPSVSTSVMGSAVESSCSYSLFVVSGEVCPTGQYCASCESLNVTTGTSMNLAPLRLADLSSSTFYRSEANNGDTFVWNICNSVTSQYCSQTPGTSVCQITSTGSQYSCGVATSTLLESINDTTSIVSYGNGDKCANIINQPSRSSFISVTCDPQFPNSVEVGSVIESSCTYYLSMITGKVCGSQYKRKSTTLTTIDSENDNVIWSWISNLLT